MRLLLQQCCRGRTSVVYCAYGKQDLLCVPGYRAPCWASTESARGHASHARSSHGERGGRHRCRPCSGALPARLSIGWSGRRSRRSLASCC